MSGEVIIKLSEANWKRMLLSIAWRNARDEWRKETHERSKLSMLKLAMECDAESSCAFLKLKSERRMMLKLRGGTAAFQIETGRRHGVKREERLSKECQSGEVEDVNQWLMWCVAWDHLGQP